MQTCTINTGTEAIETITVSGSGALNATLMAVAAVDNEDGSVRLGISSDIFDAGSMVYIEGTDNYDGIRKIRSVSAGYINLEASFTAETTATADTVKVAIAPSHSFEFLEIEAHLSSAPTTSEDFTVTKDSNLGTNFDVNLLTKDFSAGSIVSYIWTPTSRLVYSDAKDILRISWDNTDARDYGLTLKYRKI